MGASLDNDHVIAKRLARIHHPRKGEIMTKNDYKRNQFRKYKTKKE